MCGFILVASVLSHCKVVSKIYKIATRHCGIPSITQDLIIWRYCITNHGILIGVKFIVFTSSNSSESVGASLAFDYSLTTGIDVTPELIYLRVPLATLNDVDTLLLYLRVPLVTLNDVDTLLLLVHAQRSLVCWRCRYHISISRSQISLVWGHNKLSSLY